jgi:dipeptidase E
MYLDTESALRRLIAQCELLWVRGGNTFVLRYLFARSGLDNIVVEALERDAFVYGGYSAGVILLQHTLKGIERADDVDAVHRLYGAEPVWNGLGLIDYAFVPHYQSPGHPETEACDRLADHYRANGIDHRTLRDGQAIVIAGSKSEIV